MRAEHEAQADADDQDREQRPRRPYTHGTETAADLGGSEAKVARRQARPAATAQHDGRRQQAGGSDQGDARR